MKEKQETRQLRFGEQFVAGGDVYYRVQDASKLEKACQEALEHWPQTGVSYFILCGKKKVQVFPGYTKAGSSEGEAQSGGLKALVGRLTS